LDRFQFEKGGGKSNYNGISFHNPYLPGSKYLIFSINLIFTGAFHLWRYIQRWD